MKLPLTILALLVSWTLSTCQSWMPNIGPRDEWMVSAPEVQDPEARPLLPKTGSRPDLTAVARTFLARRGPIEERSVWGRVTQWYRPCGSGVRPYLLWGRPHLGTVFRVVYHIYSLPREDGIYATPGAWVIASLNPPKNYEEPVYVFPNGCVLLWDLSSPATIVWSFGGVIGYEDPLMVREGNGRVAILSLEIPNDPAFSGQRLWTQMLVMDEGPKAQPEVKTSQLIEVTIGQPVGDV